MSRSRLRLTITGLIVMNVVFQLLRARSAIRDELQIRPGGTRFPFAASEKLASGAFLFTPRNKTTGFTVPELLSLCHEGDAMTLTREWALEAPKENNPARHQLIMNYINVCYPIEMATNQGVRSMGFCSDFVQYIFHAKGRLVDEFGPSEFHAKRISCPTSTYLQGEYLRHEFLDDITISAIDTQRVAELNSVSASSLPRSLPRVRNLWLPNIEQLRHDHIPALSLMHKVLCKTRVTCTALRQYSQRNLALANTPQFQFMSHSSPDVLHDAQHVLGLARFMHLMRTTRSYNKFLHAFGKTGSKRTDQVVECWLEHPEWPALVLIGAPYAYRKNLQQAARGRKNIVQQGFVNIRALRALQIEYGVHICSSSQEGYGHYINDARSMGSLLMTTNHPPMNEFVHADGVDGILIDHDGHPFSADYQALHNEFKSAVDVRTTDICAAVERVLKLSEEERERLGAEGRRSYDQDTILMVKRMGELLEEAWKHLGADEASLKDAGRSY